MSLNSADGPVTKRGGWVWGWGGCFDKKISNVESHIALLMTVYSQMRNYSVALVRERTIPTERPPPVGEVSANFCG